jgi:hypothetical protein
VVFTPLPASAWAMWANAALAAWTEKSCVPSISASVGLWPVTIPTTAVPSRNLLSAVDRLPPGSTATTSKGAWSWPAASAAWGPTTTVGIFDTSKFAA